MAIRTLPGFKSLSEFGAYHGDCAWCALLGILHSLDPVRYPLTLTEENHLTSDAIAHGNADASLSGGANIPHLSAELTRLGIAHDTYCSYAPPLSGDKPFHPFSIDQLHADMKTHSGVHGIEVEWSKGGALPGDESAVVFHYSSDGGIDTGPAGDGIGGAYLWCDGDNSASTKNDGGSNAIRYTWGQVVAAAPIGYIIVQGATPMSWTITRDAKGQITGANCDNGDHCGAGMAAQLEARHALNTRPLVRPGEVYYLPGHSFMALDNEDLYLWHEGAPAVIVASGAASAFVGVWQLKSPPPPPPAPQGDPHAQAVGAAFLQVLAAAASK